MKLIIAIVNHDDANAVVQNLSKNGFSSTRLSTTGGFLLAGNVTLLVGVEADRVQAAIDVIREYSHSRKQMIPTTTEMSYSYIPTMPVEVRVGGPPFSWWMWNSLSACERDSRNVIPRIPHYRRQPEEPRRVCQKADPGLSVPGSMPALRPMSVLPEGGCGNPS